MTWSYGYEADTRTADAVEARMSSNYVRLAEKTGTIKERKNEMVTVALRQMNAHGFDQHANLAKGVAFCKQAASMGADLVLFPEMWNIGYTAYHDEVWDQNYDPSLPGYPELREAWKRRAIPTDGEFVMRFADLARELEVAIAITYLEATSYPHFNSGQPALCQEIRPSITRK